MRTSTESLESNQLLTAIHETPRQIQTSSTNRYLLQTHVLNFRGHKDKFIEFEHLLLNHFRPFANKITEENKIHFFQSLLRDEAIECWQTITINFMTTLTEVIALFRKEIAREDMKEGARYKWNEARYDSNNETLGDFLINLKKKAKQAFGDEAERHIRTFLFGKLPVEIQSFNGL